MLIAFDGVNLKGWDGHVDVDGFNGTRVHLTEGEVDLVLFY
jgi:hypothetical protein